MKMILSPSILGADYTRLGEELKVIDQAGAEYVHLDVMDGLFVPSISFGMPVIKGLRKATNRIFDVHLMINDPIRYIDDFVSSGADLITFHLEAAKDPKAVIDAVKAHGKKVGIAIKPKTPVSDVLPYLNDVDMVLIMTVEPGFGGQKLIPETVSKVREIRQYLNEHEMVLDVQVDGGVTLLNVSELTNAGANIIVAGSAVFKNDAAANVREFLEKMQG